MKPNERTICSSITLAVRRPETGAALLARTLTERMNGAPWIDHDTRMRFCIEYLSNLMDGNVERSVEPRVLRKLWSKPLSFGIRILRRWPKAGIAMLVAMVMEELREHQKATEEDKVAFCQEMLVRFFPEAAELKIGALAA